MEAYVNVRERGGKKRESPRDVLGVHRIDFFLPDVCIGTKWSKTGPRDVRTVVARRADVCR